MSALNPPSSDWPTADAEAHGLSGEQLERVRTDLAARQTQALLVMRHDAIVCEGYAPGRDSDQPHYTASLAKSLVGGLALMLTLDDGLLELDAPAADWIPAWRDDPAKSRITVRQLATHSSGLADAAADAAASLHTRQQAMTGWQGRFWRREPEPFTVARDAAPLLFEPGSGVAYSNPGCAMLAWVITAALQSTPHKDIRTLLRERLFQPLGLDEAHWSIGYGQTYHVDGLPLVPTWGGGQFTARAVARLGQLMLHRGRWRGQALVVPESVKAVLRRQPHADTDFGGACGLTPTPGWWTNTPRALSVLPHNAFAGMGAGGQSLVVVPHLALIVVRQGGALARQGQEWADADRHLIRPILAAFQSPAPPSTVITGVDWAPPATIRRDGYDSDTWPATWADDGHLYAAWADGQGFAEPPVERKTSLGFARIEGGPDDFRGLNVRSTTGEDLGNGPTGKKGCGMLMVDGVLYLFARNANRRGEQSQLAWSHDHARTWHWAAWRFELFGTCTFLNFGRDYANARDGYVYVYSHDHPSAYIGADRMILLRVPRDAIGQREAYECYAGLDADGQPRFSANLDDRVAVFTHRGRCVRSTVSHNAPLGRYLWWQQVPNTIGGDGHDTRFVGGFGLYEAPEPWGPWRTVCYTEHWDVGPGETGTIPTKWISADGRDIALLFSGDDYFSVRRGTLRLADAAGTGQAR